MMKKKNWVIGSVILVVVLFLAVLENRKTPPSISSGVTKDGIAKLSEYDGVMVKIDVPDGKYVAFASEGKIFQVSKVKNGKYAYKDIADENSYNVTAYATDEKPDEGDKASSIKTIGSVKFKIPVEKIGSDDSDYSDDDSDDTDEYTEDETDDDTDYSDDADSSVSEDPSTKTYRTDISYDQLARDPDSFKGEDFTLTGKVIQELEDEDTVQLRVAINGDYDDIVLVQYDASIMSGKRVLEDDKVTFSGTSVGTTTYESTSGGDITIPAATVDKIVDSGTAPDNYGYEY